MASTMVEAMNGAGKLKTKKPAVVNITVTKIKKVQVTAKREELDRVAEDVRQYLAGIHEHMMNLISRIREISAATLEEWMIRSDELKKLEDEVLSHLNADAGPLLTAARQAYARAMVETLPADKRAVLEAIKGGGKPSRLPGLVGIGVLAPAKGQEPKYDIVVKVYGESYKVVGGREFALKIAETLSDKAGKAAKAAHDNYHGAAAELKAQATITVVQLLGRRPGQVAIDAPDAEIPDGKGGKKFLPGGVVLVESDGEFVKVVRSVGHFSRIMEEIAKAETFISVASLSQERVVLTKRLPEDAFRRIRILHAVIRRGLAAYFVSQKPADVQTQAAATVH